jgi:Lipopolysaccharide-assembly
VSARFHRAPASGGPALVLALATSLLAGLAACGYHAGLILPEGVRTVAVPVFDNDTFRREIEVELTQAVAGELSGRTPLRIVADAADADLVVRGRIQSFEQRVLADRGRNTITESSVVVGVKVVLENRLAGTRKTLALTTREPFSTFKGQSLASARAEAFENLAEQIAHALEGDWPEPVPTKLP